MSADITFFRQAESVLDNAHTTLPLWSRSHPESTFAILAAFDMMMIPLGLGIAGVEPNVSTVQKAKEYHDALIYALRFFFNDDNRLPIRPTNNKRLIEEAFDFLRHCGIYGNLCDFHIGHGRGLYTLETEEAKKRIRFIPMTFEGASLEPTGMIEDAPSHWEHMADSVRDLKTVKETMRLLTTIPNHVENGLVIIDDLSHLNDAVLDKALIYLLPAHRPELSDDTSLCGFTALEYQKYWHALIKWSMSAFSIYMEATLSGKQQNEYLPTQYMAYSTFIDGIISLSQLPAAIVSECTERITYGNKCPKKPDNFLQPLIRAGEYISWSPHLVQLCKYKRNMLKLMARIPEYKETADGIIGSKDVDLVSSIGQLLAKHGYHYKTHAELPDGTGEIDILAYRNNKPKEMLLAEIKCVLGVDEINEVNSATSEMISGQEQLARSIDFLKKCATSQKKKIWNGSFWDTIEIYYGMVISPNSQPNSRYDQREYPALTFETLMRYYYPSDFVSPRRLWKTSVNKRWLKDANSAELFFSPIKVGEYTYEIPTRIVNTDISRHS
jgi:hypothetical protein